MGKLLDNLNKQLERPEHRNDAEECLVVYNYLKDSTGHVWSSTWNELTTVSFSGGFANSVRTYKLSPVGHTYFQGVRTTKQKENKTAIDAYFELHHGKAENNSH